MGRFKLMTLDPTAEPETFATIRDLAVRIIKSLEGADVWLGDCNGVIGVPGEKRDTAFRGVFVRKLAGRERGDFVGIAIMPVDPSLGSFGQREQLETAIKRAFPRREAA